MRGADRIPARGRTKMTRNDAKPAHFGDALPASHHFVVTLAARAAH
jgi:hypothetical protein